MSEEGGATIRKTFPELVRKIVPDWTDAEIQELDRKLHTGEWDEDQLSPLMRFIWELHIELIELENEERLKFEHQKRLLEIRYQDVIAKARDRYEKFLQRIITERRDKGFEQKEHLPREEEYRELYGKLKGKRFIEALQLMTSTLTREEIKEYDRKVRTVGTDIRQFPPGIQFVWRMFCKTIRNEERYLIICAYQNRLFELEYKERLQQKFEMEKKQIDLQRKKEWIKWLWLIFMVIVIYLLVRFT